MSAQLIQSLIPLLPRYAEEESDFYSVPRDYLISGLCQQHQIERNIAENTIDLVESLLTTLATLNTDCLKNGEWCFVSFPAQLLATSVLTALGDTESRLFAPSFWNTQSISNDKKERQRDVLCFIENARFDNHVSKNAQPIRFIYVAWGIIKVDNKILMYQREDTKKRHDRTAGDYGLIGGRLNQTDVINISDKTDLLNALQSPDSAMIKSALPETLKRELREETGLIFETHYTFKPWRSLKPHLQVQGAAPNHALTEYYLKLFLVELTLDGYLFLQQKIKSDERLTWFSIDEMMNGVTSDGKIAFLTALYADFADDKSVLKTELVALPNSFAANYLFQPTKYGLTLPVVDQKPIIAGTLGKEKPLGIKLTHRQLTLLLGLASHLRRFNFANVEKTCVFYPFGWIQVIDNPTLQLELISLAGLLKEADLKIENHRDTLFRLSITPDVVYFDESLFSFTIKAADLDGIQAKIPVTIHRNTFNTAFGTVEEKTQIFMLTLEFVHKLRLLVDNQFTADNEVAQKIEDTYKKGLHQESDFEDLGLKRLICRDNGIMKFVISFATE